MTDLAETIERIRRQLKGVHPSVAVVLPPMHHAAITRLLDAAEAGLRARDAALEEAAVVADKEAALQLDRVKNSRLTFAPDAAREIAAEIRKRKGAA